jgi:hypothetical protein
MGAFAMLLLYERFFAADNEVAKAGAYRVLRRNVRSFSRLEDYLDVIVTGG